MGVWAGKINCIYAGESKVQFLLADESLSSEAAKIIEMLIAMP